jgi:hypothetical protein
MRVCYLDCHEAGVCCYLVIHVENVLRPLQMFCFHLWPIYWLSHVFNVRCAKRFRHRWEYRIRFSYMFMLSAGYTFVALQWCIYSLIHLFMLRERLRVFWVTLSHLFSVHLCLMRYYVCIELQYTINGDWLSYSFVSVSGDICSLHNKGCIFLHSSWRQLGDPGKRKINEQREVGKEMRIPHETERK